MVVLDEYHKFDSIAYPQNTSLSKSFLKNMKEHAYGFLSAVSGGFFGKKEKDDQQEIPENFKPMNHQDMSVYCLEHYLLKYKEMLSTGSFSGFDVHTLAVDIAFIYNSLIVEYISATGDSTSCNRQERKVDHMALKNVSITDDNFLNIIRGEPERSPNSGET